MKPSINLTFSWFSAGVLSPCRGLALGLACGTAAWATPQLYICPGPLFTNDLTSAQAKAQGCELATRGRWSQAQGNPEQAMANPDPGTANVTTPTSAEAGSLPGSVLSAVSPASTTASAATTAPTPALAASTSPTAATAPPATAAAASPPGTPPAPANTAARRPPESVADASRQRQRDAHAREIVLAELTRTQARIQTLSAQPPSGPDAESALLRLRLDEDALRRELARRPG